MRRYSVNLLLFLMILSLMFVSNVFTQESLEDKVSSAISNYYFEPFDVESEGNGNITIEGTVNTLSDKYRIFEIAAKVPGVKTISNQVIVNTPDRPDGIIKSDILQEMEYVSSILEPDSINVEVTNGVVFLEGTVSFYREKLAMRTIASWQEGVKGIVNNITVLPPEKAKSDENLEDVLTQILKNDFPLEENVNIMVEDGKVTLEGSVTTLWAKYNLAETFKDVIGIRKVDNNLNVESII